MDLLYVGFKGSYNNSFRLVNEMAGNHLFLTNSFAGLRNDISHMKRIYDNVLMFGVDKKLNGEIRIETRAERNGNCKYSTVDVKALSDQLECCGIHNKISNNPTSYLCNDAYYEMLTKCANSQVVFIHIPSKRGMTEVFFNKLLIFFQDKRQMGI